MPTCATHTRKRRAVTLGTDSNPLGPNRPGSSLSSTDDGHTPPPSTPPPSPRALSPLNRAPVSFSARPWSSAPWFIAPSSLSSLPPSNDRYASADLPSFPLPFFVWRESSGCRGNDSSVDDRSRDVTPLPVLEGGEQGGLEAACYFAGPGERLEYVCFSRKDIAGCKLDFVAIDPERRKYGDIISELLSALCSGAYSRRRWLLPIPHARHRQLPE